MNIKLSKLYLTAKFVVSRCAFCKLRRSFGFFCSVDLLEGGLLRETDVYLIKQVKKDMVCEF